MKPAKWSTTLENIAVDTISYGIDLSMLWLGKYLFGFEIAVLVGLATIMLRMGKRGYNEERTR